jgi:chromosome segregation ATPase
MGEDLGRLLNIALAVVAIATLGGFGYVRGRIGDLRDQLKDAREEIADKDRRLTKVTTEAQQLRTDLDALSRVVTGEAHWTAIGDKLDEHHRDAEGHWTDEKTLLEEIRDRLPAPPPPRRGF